MPDAPRRASDAALGKLYCALGNIHGWTPGQINEIPEPILHAMAAEHEPAEIVNIPSDAQLTEAIRRVLRSELTWELRTRGHHVNVPDFAR